MTRKLTIGVDFGTESVRALVLDITTGEETAEAVHSYPHGVIDRFLPLTGRALGSDWALQHPGDWLEGLNTVVREAVERAQARPEEVIGLGIDFTSCTVLPTLSDGTPMCRLGEWSSFPHAWPKLWKHHAAQPQADRINQVAAEVPGLDLADYGGRLSSEWVLPKALQLLEEAPEVFHAAERFIEAGDWITWMLTGREARSGQAAGFKGAYRAEVGAYPPAAFLEALTPGFSGLLTKLSTQLHAAGERMGGLSPEWAAQLGLLEDTAVATGNMDAQVAVVACGSISAGDMTLVMGTSVCNLLQADSRVAVEGMSGRVRDAIVPGLWTYEAGQAGVGDMFAWFVRNAVPAAYEAAARKAGTDVYVHLESLASRINPGQNHVLALDWWNGNRSVLTDDHLSGTLIGMTLATRAEHIYRALLEAAALSQRVIIDSFEEAGAPVRRIVACGGLPHRSPLLMQILADVTGREIEISGTRQASARGAAIHAATAAGPERGGFPSLKAASSHLASPGHIYRPVPTASAAYEAVLDDYLRLHDLLGRHHPDLMYRLRRRSAASEQSNYNEVQGVTL
jgi:L-ribulokinase